MCAKIAKPIEMQFGMMSQVGPSWGVVAPTGRGTFEVWPIEKHCRAQDFGGWV